MFLLIIAGLLLRLTNGWFTDQHMVGDICLWVGGITTLVWLLIFVVVFVGIRQR